MMRRQEIASDALVYEQSIDVVVCERARYCTIEMAELACLGAPSPPPAALLGVAFGRRHAAPGAVPIVRENGLRLGRVAWLRALACAGDRALCEK